jgi:hypothetical protein
LLPFIRCNRVKMWLMSASGVSNASRGRQHDGSTDDTAASLIRLLAGFCGALAVLSLLCQDWIEALTGFDPDQHNGTVEWLIVIALLATAPYWRSRRRVLNGTRPDDV